jgi:hypothetical protein
MLPHEDSGVRVVDDIAGEPRKLGDHFLSDIRVSLSRDKHTEARRAEEGGDEPPGACHAPRFPHDAGMSRHPHEFVKDRPSCVPRVGTAALPLDPIARFDVPLRIRVGGVNKDVRVDENQPLPPFHGFVQGVAVCDVDARAPAIERWQGREIGAFFSRLEKAAQRGLNELGHRPPLPRRFALELGHDRVVDIERRLHMENHIDCMANSPAGFRSPPSLPIPIRRGRADRPCDPSARGGAAVRATTSASSSNAVFQAGYERTSPVLSFPPRQYCG